MLFKLDPFNKKIFMLSNKKFFMVVDFIDWKK